MLKRIRYQKYYEEPSKETNKRDKLQNQLYQKHSLALLMKQIKLMREHQRKVRFVKKSDGLDKFNWLKYLFMKLSN